MTQMQAIWDGFIGMVGALVVLAGFVGAVEGIFRPIRRSIERRDQRIMRDDRIETSLERLETHFVEARERDLRIGELELMSKRQQRQIEDNRDEHALLWRGMKAILSALQRLVPDDSDITEAIRDMDDYANRNMR